MSNDKLAKLIARAASDNDAEALSAIRMARYLLLSKGKDWDDLVAVVLAATSLDAPTLDDLTVQWHSRNQYFANETLYKYRKFLTEEERDTLTMFTKIDHLHDPRDPRNVQVAIYGIVRQANLRKPKPKKKVTT